jgi:hypothetical protein
MAAKAGCAVAVPPLCAAALLTNDAAFMDANDSATAGDPFASEHEGFCPFTSINGSGAVAEGASIISITCSEGHAGLFVAFHLVVKCLLLCCCCFPYLASLFPVNPTLRFLLLFRFRD